MLRSISIWVILIATNAICQTTYVLDQNQALALVNDDGIFFQNTASNAPGYEIPAESGNHTTYGMSFWMTSIDDTGLIYSSCQAFSGNTDLFTGPISDDYSNPWYLETYDTAIWKVTRDEIEYHMSNFTAIGYSPSQGIASWPGNGNSVYGVAEQLAPYVDLDNNSLYEPLLGDYPFILGDQALYVILNDDREIHSTTGGASFGVELHCMFYQFEATGDLDSTTFLNVKVINRSDRTYDDFAFGLFADFDLGHFSDDYIGSDSANNLFFVYNCHDVDPGGNGQPGYGANSPAFGTMFLNKQSNSFMANAPGTPSPPGLTGFYEFMRATWPGAGHLLFGGNGYDLDTTSIETNYLYSGNPNLPGSWSEASLLNISSDRRGIMSAKEEPLNAGDNICYDIAFIYSRDGSNNLENAENLVNVAIDIQEFYETDIQPCDAIFSQSSFPYDPIFSVFPNPSSGNFSIWADQPGLAILTDLNGKMVLCSSIVIGKNDFEKDFASGIYLLRITTSGEAFTTRLVIR